MSEKITLCGISGLILILINCCVANDITRQVFGNIQDGIVAAFGDFNSDELTDVFLLRRNKDNKFNRVEILLGADTEPLLRSGPKCEFDDLEITSVVPGDFDGDAYMDVLITTKSKENKKNIFDIYINWGGSDYLNCSDGKPVIKSIYGEPLAIDFNRDMIIDLFGLNGTENEHTRTFWIFQNERNPPIFIHQADPQQNSKIKVPHAHAYLDLNNDFTGDLFLQAETLFEIHLGDTNNNQGFIYHENINLPVGIFYSHIGQTVFLDMELKGVQNQILPICQDIKCSNSTLMMFTGNISHDLHINFKDPQGVLWGFVAPNSDDPYTKVITARGGDFNMDGYPDLLVTLNSISNTGKFQTFLLENVPCKVWCGNSLTRTFEVKWNAFAPMGNSTIAGAFYDFYQDGVLDVILIEKKGQNYKPLAFRNTLDYDANFVKVIVLTGLVNKMNATTITPLGRKRRTYGTNLPGPRIVYYTTTQEGDNQHGASAQLPQSAYFALQLPYTIFGLGRTPNFVDSLTVGLANKSRTWTQLIPNSQVIVVPQPLNEPQRWKAQLFVTPSKLILMSVIALGGTCFVITLIILGLYIKEKREDKQEKLQEAHRFHFDAM